MSKLDHAFFKPNKTNGVSLSNTYLAEALGIKPGDGKMVMAVSYNGRVLLKSFSPNDLMDASDKAALGFVEDSGTPQLEPSAGDAPVNFPEDNKSDKPDA